MIDYQLTGKTAIVTGGVSGIGLAAAQTLAASGARVSVWDLKQDAVDATVARLQGSGAQAIGIALDVTDDAAVEAAVQRTVRELGGVHVAVNNAGISGPAASSGDYPIDGWQRVIDVNLTSVFLCQRAQIQAMRAAGTGGSIINMASILGQVGYAGSTAYVAAKHGVVGLTQTAAWEYAADGIRVNAVGPGFISTPLLEKMDPKVRATLEGRHALKRLGTAEEVAALVAWLASDDASFATGAYYAIDGGYLAQ
ncbi:SDR family oxidoreductase [Stenotrophomonas sp. GD03908]|uniref:SDR family NAD(P)-dependent oxidoreductase n=1 Tax=Stenotrophomonas maltophilia TaxID=40324 RepID=A0AAJ2WKL7_STEMA|nr:MULTISPECIES: SDR family NAD(P)-dependent oxidoreductase [Stenotrophomonas]MBH1483123.1 SDR family oxidoreductase [Stenotrophomonas maltophilia]MCU1062301.1 SDR family oxidoreductase [Stenotrophomonas maltophilia]MDH0980694.1 SDR family oxidoreductase [Stenotrophomonas sp. GD03908]MDQ7294541.1 SDR family NAD(P)-dependent oxidoreductase [Stenotrophomonas sp. Sm0041]MDZ5765976.1 SDR family NAD(P)-dependent oxidoreductase [Stenotrophomonas maltophilia]